MINWPEPSYIGEIYTSPLGASWVWNGYGWDTLGDGSEYKYIKVSLTSSDILSMGSSPKLLLANPGAGFYYDIDKIVLEYTRGSVSYSEGAFKFHIAIQSAQIAIIDRRLLTAGANKVSIVEPTKYLNTDGYNLHIASELSTSLSITTTTGDNYINGDGTMDVKIWYTIRSFG